jgi:secondary thiamine-phosphate synthase enzyme
MTVVEVSTAKKKEIVDLTDLCRKWLPNPKKADGVCHLFLLHTTAALTTADLDPGTDLDLLDAFDALVPKLTYRHPHDPTHTPDHVLSALLGTSLSIPVKNGEPVLGEWQKIVLVELDGPRNREIAITFITEKSAVYP